MEWIAFWLAPAAATLQVMAGYALVKPACGLGGIGPLHAVSLLSLGMTAGGVLMAWPRRPTFIGSVALGLNLIVAVLVLFAMIPHFVLSPCE